MEDYIEIYNYDLDSVYIYSLYELEDVLEDITESEKNQYNELKTICDSDLKIEFKKTEELNVIRILQKDIDEIRKKIENYSLKISRILRTLPIEEKKNLLGYKLKLIECILDHIIVKINVLISKDKSTKL